MNFDEQTYQTIEAYLNETLSETARVSFEKRMESDPNLALEIRINREMRLQYGTTNIFGASTKHDPELVKELKDHLQSEEINALSKKIKEGKKMYEATASKKPIVKYVYYAAAAIALVLLVNTFFINNISSTEELYAEYSDWENLPSLTSKGVDQNNLAKGEALFTKEKYTDAISIFKDEKYRSNPQVLIYLGISYLESDTYDKALTSFNQLLQGNTLESHKAYWYIALTHLKQGNNKKAIEYLQLLRKDKNNYQYKKAGELLLELNRI